MNRSVDAVTKLWSRALVKLQQELERSESMEQ
jgi:DNA-directed RNA polymerase specialized sigma24 family protein